MELERLHGPRNSNEEITIWQTKSYSKDEVGVSSGIIGSLFDAIISCFQGVLHELIQRSPEPAFYVSLEKNAAALLFWGSHHSVSQGDLDRTLQHSQVVRDMVLLVLISIGDILSQSSPLQSAISARPC